MKMSKSELSLSVLMNIYKASFKKILLSMTALMVIVVAYSFILPVEYKSEASVLPPKQGDSGGGLSSFLQSVSGGGIVLGGLGQTNQTQIFSEILQSRSMAEYVIKKCKLKENPDFSKMSDEQLLDLVKNIFVIDINRSGLLVISGTAKTGYFANSAEKLKASKLSADLTNAAIEALDMIVRNRSVSNAKQSRIYIEKALSDFRLKLDSIEQKLEKFQKENKVIKIEEQTEALVKQAIDIGSELAKAETDLNLAKREYSANSSVLKQMEANVRFLREQYSKVQSGGISAGDEFSIPFNSIPSLARIYANLIRDRKIYEQVILYLETQRHQEAIQESRDVPVVEVLDKAYPPESQSAPSKKLMFILGFFLSLIIVLSWFTYSAIKKGNLIIKQNPVL